MTMASCSTREDVLQVLHGGGQLTVLDHGLFDVLQVLDGVDALSPVLTEIGQRGLDVLHVTQRVVELRQTCTYAIELRLDCCLREKKK